MNSVGQFSTWWMSKLVQRTVALLPALKTALVFLSVAILIWLAFCSLALAVLHTAGGTVTTNELRTLAKWAAVPSIVLIANYFCRQWQEWRIEQLALFQALKR